MFQFERAALDKFLKSLKYPQSKQKIMEAVKSADLPPQMPAILQRLGDREYTGAEDVEKELAARKAA